MPLDILIFGSASSGATFIAADLRKRLFINSNLNDTSSSIFSSSSLIVDDHDQLERNQQEQRAMMVKMMMMMNNSNTQNVNHQQNQISVFTDCENADESLSSSASQDGKNNSRNDDELAAISTSDYKCIPFNFSQRNRFEDLLKVIKTRNHERSSSPSNTSSQTTTKVTIAVIDLVSWIMFAAEGGFFASAQSNTTDKHQAQGTSSSSSSDNNDRIIIEEVLTKSFSELCLNPQLIAALKHDEDQSGNIKLILVLTKFTELEQLVQQNVFLGEEMMMMNKKKKNRKNYDFFTMLAQFVVNHMDVVFDRILAGGGCRSESSRVFGKSILIDFEGTHHHLHRNDNEDDYQLLNMKTLVEELLLRNGNGDDRQDSSKPSLPMNSYKPPLMAKIKKFFSGRG